MIYGLIACLICSLLSIGSLELIERRFDKIEDILFKEKETKNEDK